MLELIALASEMRGYDPQDRDIAAPAFCGASSDMKHLLAALQVYVERDEKEITPQQRRCAGYHLEAVAALAFAGLEGLARLEQVKTVAAEYDLIVSGKKAHDAWRVVREYLRLSEHRDSVLVEVKATKDRVTDAQFLRLCALIDTHFETEVGLGVFFTLAGASGFPDRGSGDTECLRDARLHQALYHSRRGVPVVVLDYHDIITLAEPGALLRVLDQRIHELGLLTGKREEAPTHAPRVTLQPHLHLARKFVERSSD